MCIGAGRGVTQYSGLRNLTHKQDMRSQILLAKHLAGKHCVCVFRHIQQTVMASFYSRDICEFVGIPTGLHTKMANCFERNIFSQYADIENTCLFNHFAGQISFLDGNDQLIWIFCHLNTGVANAAVILVRHPGAKNKQSIGQLIQRRGVFRRLLLLSESSAPADPSMLCRVEPRPLPFHELLRFARNSKTVSWQAFSLIFHFHFPLQ